MNRQLPVLVLIFSLLVGGAALSAQDAPGEQFIALAGSSGPGNVDVHAFAPQSLTIHRGDTVTWHILGFHNVRFASEFVDFIIAPEVDGVVVPQLNPDVALATLENGGTYTGGVAGSGLPLDGNPSFSVTFDVEPGTYTYVCDVHPGMLGTVTVVPDDQPVDPPHVQFARGLEEIGFNLAAAEEAISVEGDAAAGLVMSSGGAQVTAGGHALSAAVLAYFPQVVVINAGDSVTWTVDPLGIEPFTVTSLPLPTSDEQFQVEPPASPGGQPVIALSAAFLPDVVDGQTIRQGDSFNSGFMLPGTTLTLVFTEPGVYNYGSFLHTGVRGTVVVMPAV